MDLLQDNYIEGYKSKKMLQGKTKIYFTKLLDFYYINRLLQADHQYIKDPSKKVISLKDFLTDLMENRIA